MKARNVFGRGTFLAWFLVSASALGQTQGFPKFNDGVAQPPKEVVKGAPFDVKALFDAPPFDQNAAPLYLDAFFEFTPDLSSCFPEGPKIEPRRKAASERMDRFYKINQALEKDPKSVSDATIDASLAEHRVGFEKLAKAQQRERCVFQTGIDSTALLPHLHAARQITRVAQLRVRRSLEKGDIASAIEDLKITLRLARDLQPRGHAISQISASAINAAAVKSMLLPILAAPRLTPENCDQLMAAVNDRGPHAVDAYSESLKIEYLNNRATLLDLIHDQDKIAKARQVPRGESLIKNMFQITFMALKDPQKAPTGPGAPNFPSDIDVLVARTTPAELDHVTAQLNTYCSQLLAIKDRPTLEKLAKAPDVRKAISGDKPIDLVVRELQSPVLSIIQAFGRNDANLAAAQCLTAVRRWQLTHEGASPDNLAAACKAAGLKSVPIDPYDAKPMRLAQVDGAPVVYSIGKDGRDDGGKVDSAFDTKPGDQIFRLSPAKEKADARS